MLCHLGHCHLGQIDHYYAPAVVRQRLYGSQELQARLGVSRTRVRQIAEMPSFPVPLDTIAAGRVWDAGEVDAWIRAHRPGVVEDEAG